MKRKLISFIFLSFVFPNLLFASLKKEAKQICASLRPHLTSKDQVAILDFVTQDGKTNYLGRYFSDAISAELANNKFNVVERSDLETLMNESKLQLSGAVRQQDLAKLGNLLGANTIVYGTITEFDRNYDISLKLSEVETGKTRGGASTQIKKTSAIRKLVETITQEEIEKEKELEAERQRIIEEINLKQTEMLNELKAEENIKRNKLAELDAQLRSKSLVLKKHKEKEGELIKIDESIEEIKEKIKFLTGEARSKIELGMTAQEIVGLIGPPRGKDECPPNNSGYNYGEYWIYFQGGIAAKKVYYTKWQGACATYDIIPSR